MDSAISANSTNNSTPSTAITRADQAGGAQYPQGSAPSGQLPRLQQLLERPAPPLRPSRLPVVPRHANMARQFECTRLITAEQVKQIVRQIPGFGVIGRN
jgi:hypothetical protein